MGVCVMGRERQALMWPLEHAGLAEDTERREAGAELETRDDRQFAELVGRFELRQVALSLDEGRALSGATAEVVQEMRNAGGYQGIPIPLAALETRAGETVAADQVNPKAIRPVIDRLFPGSVAERLGVQRINITQGEVEFPVATAGAVFGWQTTELGDVAAASEYRTTERSLNPDHTGGAQMVISRKALKQAGEGLESAIRRDLNAAIGAELDRVTINGSGAAGPLATAKQIASMSKMPVLSEFRRYPVNFAFEGLEHSESSRARIIDGSTSPVRGRYLVVPLPASDDLLYKVARGDDVQDLLDHTSEKAGQAAHHLVVDHLAIAQRVMVAVDGPLYRVVSEEVIE